MRGGLERWKRGVDSRGVRHAISYALKGTCDAHMPRSTGVEALEAYGAASDSTVSVHRRQRGHHDRPTHGRRPSCLAHRARPGHGEERGRQRLSPDADLLLEGTLNHPKSYSIAALLHPELAEEFEALQDRLRERILLTWKTELNARRGHGGLIREEITRIEVVELQHRRSRALDPHIHRHLWLNVRDEIAAIDSSVIGARAPRAIAATDLHALDLKLLASAATVDADARSTSSGGRFSTFDIRAGATLALSRTGIVAPRDQLDGVISEITTRAAKSVHRLVAEAPPAHVEAFMATETVRAKVRLAGHLDVLARQGRSLLPNELYQFAANENIAVLDASQRVAACAISRSDRLVTVAGPARTGKTTMLRVSFAALSAQRRQTLVVAPTRKAASVASREVGAATSNIQTLLSDHVYR